ncbi:hypothetical protein AMYX_20280 [Anaeromyxobacter diazotrophicus]|uniref:Transglycosylase SLT domain-containing protein n=1 Tax=Anaeromyxobacter diazotrophicus TaxID=2590199 RepID=A0A7I9VMS7_9BACT|nr:hypothetical protein AMYX_20280 [Anaeromyxobacter diazotrophicus]
MSTSAQALAEGDAAGAEIAARTALAAVPGGAPGARAELALGLALREASRFGEAFQALDRAAPRLADPALAAVARLESAEALFYAGHPGAAAARFAEVAALGQGTLARRARLREADALLAAGSAARAARAYEALLSAEPAGPAAYGLRLSLAAALRDAGEPARAVTVYRALWVEQPADPAGRDAGRALLAWRAAGGAVPPPTAEERLARAARFLELSLPRRAVETLDRLAASAPPPEPRSRGVLLRALALLQLGRREQARALAEELQRDPAAAPGTRAGAELVLARAAARSGQVDDAARRYRLLARVRGDIPGVPAAQARELPDEAAFLSAWLYYDAGAYAKAAGLLRAFAREHPKARRADDARWFEAWSLYRLGRRDAAARALSRLAPGPLAAGALYWQARLAPKARAPALYRAALREAAPGSWYALLAAGRLAALGERPAALASPAPGALPDGPGHGRGGELLSRAARLLGAGLPAQAVAELRALAATREARDRAAAVAQLAEAAGDAELPFRMARDHLAPTRRALRWLYPRAFPGLLPAAAAQAGLDPDLYLAVMRRESAFRPDARSAAGAVGLVQLIPPTAERLALAHELPPSAVAELERPEVSVPLGAAYLSLLVDRFQERCAALAAYNAGPAAAAAWGRAAAGEPLDVWVEDIAFRETRRYVKAVAADAAVYRALWAGGPLAIDGAIPVPPPREGVAF